MHKVAVGFLGRESRTAAFRRHLEPKEWGGGEGNRGFKQRRCTAPESDRKLVRGGDITMYTNVRGLARVNLFIAVEDLRTCV